MTDLERKKLKLEILKLQNDLKPLGEFSTRIWPVVSTLLTILLSVIAVVVSLRTQYNQRLADEAKHHDESLADAVKMATDASLGVDRRIAGIWQLDRFWSAPSDAEYIGSVLAAELALDEMNRFARCAAAEVLGHAMERLAAGDRPRVAQLLFGSREGRHGLVVQQHSLLRTPGVSDPTPSNECVTPLDATREAVRKNWRYLREVNLQDMDLRRIQLYQADLARTLMRRSDLGQANLRCANLAGADLTGATNYEHAAFEYANVTNLEPQTIRDFAKAHGAVEVSDDTWGSWSKNEFRLDEARRPATSAGEFNTVCKAYVPDAPASAAPGRVTPRQAVDP